MSVPASYNFRVFTSSFGVWVIAMFLRCPPEVRAEHKHSFRIALKATFFLECSRAFATSHFNYADTNCRINRVLLFFTFSRPRSNLTFTSF